MAAPQTVSNGATTAGANGSSPASPPSNGDIGSGRTEAATASTGATTTAAKSMPSTRRHSGEHVAGSAGAAPANGQQTPSGMSSIGSVPREDSLSADLERLRINAQAAKNGAQNGGVGAIGSRDGRPAPGSRMGKASLGNGSGGIAASLARAGSNTGSATNANEAQQMSTFLFDDDLDNELHNSTYGGRYLQMNADDDKFPVLIRRDSYPGILSASSAALDLAPLSQTPPRNSLLRNEAGGRTSEWPQFTDNNSTNTASVTGQQQKSGTGSNTPVLAGAAAAASANGAGSGTPSSAAAGGAGAGSRVSGDFSNGPARSRTVLVESTTTSSPRSRQLPPPRAGTTGTPTSATSSGTGAAQSTAATTAAGASLASERSSPSLESAKITVNGAAAGAASAGLPTSPEEMKRKAQLIRERERLERASAANNNGNAHLEGHKFSDGTPSPAAMYANELAALNGTFSPYPLDRGYNNGQYGGDAYGPFGQRRPGGPGGPGGAAGAAGQKRDEPNRFAGLRLEDLQGDMAALCKDQHGCRFLQKKLEEGNAEHRDMIFNEIFPKFGDLMTDSFGNYLSQKLLEHASDEQRDALLESISGELVSISLNMHGTRAVQKMIDYLSTQRQVQSLIMALNLNVVTLIKDLNGNHVIQKCLNTLPPEDNQFIYNAVANNCIEVATHRHGCCVLQRCIDHASESQRIQLVTEITYNSLTLVLDPFGNYVVQYVLDLNDSRFITAIVNQFRNNVCALSAQKFSSNVVEKCIRVADLEGRKALISELIDRSRLERMLRDSFANYVVQTALDYAEPGQRAELVAIIRPVLPMIRNTPYGKRIQSKIQREGFHDGYGRGPYHHGGMYGGPMGMGPGAYYGMPYGGPPPHAGPGMGYGHGPHGGPPHPHAYGGPAGEGPMGRGAGPYGHFPQHMQPHMASPAMSQPFSPSFGPSPVPMDYPQAPNYSYL